MNKQEILNIQIKAINEYIDWINICERDSEDISKAYSYTINIFRQKAGLKTTGELSDETRILMKKLGVKSYGLTEKELSDKLSSLNY